MDQEPVIYQMGKVRIVTNIRRDASPGTRVGSRSRSLEKPRAGPRVEVLESRGVKVNWPRRPDKQTMERAVDVAIIGAGQAGIATSWHLSQARSTTS
jgi:hypothetical protein